MSSAWRTPTRPKIEKIVTENLEREKKKGGGLGYSV